MNVPVNRYKRDIAEHRNGKKGKKGDDRKEKNEERGETIRRVVAREVATESETASKYD